MKADFDQAPAVQDDGLALDPRDNEIWINTNDAAHKVAMDIILRLEGTGMLTLCAIGAGAVNQAVKGIAIARDKMLTEGFYDLIVQPCFSTIHTQSGDTRSRMLLFVTAVNM